MVQWIAAAVIQQGSVREASMDCVPSFVRLGKILSVPSFLERFNDFHQLDIIWSRQQAFHLGWRDSEMNPTTCHDFSPTKDNRDGLNSRVTVLVYNSPPSFQEQFSLATIWPSMCCAWSPLGHSLQIVGRRKLHHVRNAPKA